MIAASHAGPQRRQRTASGAVTGAQETKDITFVFHGVLRRLDKKEIDLEPTEDNRMHFIHSRKTRFFLKDKEVPADQVHVGDHVMIEALQKLNGDLEALRVTVELPAGDSDPSRAGLNNNPHR